MVMKINESSIKSTIKTIAWEYPLNNLLSHYEYNYYCQYENEAKCYCQL